MANKYAYGIFGQVIAEEEQVENPFKYVGAIGVMDEGNGTYFMRARYYDPEVGRFISKDPIGLFGGINMYAYVGNAPANWIDPLGLGAVDVIFSGIGTLDPGGTGATVGSTVGAVIGGGIGYAVGNVPGAFIGAGLGYLGGRFLGGLFDPEYAGQPNYGEEQMIRVREAGLEGEMYIDRVINKTKQLTQELQELNDWLRTRKECQKEKR